MTDFDSDVPDLVESSSDEESCRARSRTNADIAEIWVKKSEKFLEKQEHNIKLFSLGPFLFAISNVAPCPWNVALKQAGLLKGSRERDLTGLEWDEWGMVDLMELVITNVVKKMKKDRCIINVLDVLDKVDTLMKGVSIDVDKALSEAGKHNSITDVWTTILKSSEYAGREKQVKFGTLFVMKIYQLHVLSTGKDSKDFGEEMRKKIKRKENTESHREMGNEFHKHMEYAEAVRCYTRAAEADPFNHFYFGNRAQSYSKLLQFKDALADGRRAIILKPDWYKGHYRYAQALHKLNKLDMAIRVNKNGLAVCHRYKVDPMNLRDLEKQAVEFQKEKQEQEQHARVKQVTNLLPAALNVLPGNKKVINLREAWSCYDDDQDGDGPPPLVGSDEETDEKKTTTGNKVRRGTVTVISDRLPKTASSQGNSDKSAKNMKGFAKSKSPVPDEAFKLDIATNLPAVKKRKDSSEITELMLEGTNNLLAGTPKAALSWYKKALDLVAQRELKCLGIDKEDLVALKYAFGMAAVAKGLSKPIMDGMAKFCEIIQSHADVKFPLAYYGLGKANIALNKYIDALEPLRNGLAIAQKVRFSSITWPGSNIKVEESDPEKLRALLKELLQQCKYPPTPDAVCRFHVDPEDSREVIYFSDPDFKGFVRMSCQSYCVLELHEVCWRTYKTRFGDKIYDKEVLDTQCPTPDCVALIVKIVVFRSDSMQKEHVSEKNPPKPVKPKSSRNKVVQQHNTKTGKKQEKEKKQKKYEVQEERDDLMEDVDKILSGNKENQEPVGEVAPASTAEPASEEVYVPKPASESLMMLKKEEDDAAAKYKVAKKQHKQKKKKEKVKHVLNVEVNFSDRKEETLLGEYSVNSDDEAAASGGLDPHNPFSVPPELRDTIEAFENSYIGGSSHRIQHDDVTENLFLFFADILQARGPLHIQDPILANEVEAFPEEAKEVVDNAGGLSEFLRQSLRFAMIEDIVCLLKDAVKARELALRRRGLSVKDDLNNPTLNPHASVFQPKDNPWKTVSKGFRPSIENYGDIGSEYPTLQNSAGSHFMPPTLPKVEVEETSKSDITLMNNSMLDFMKVSKSSNDDNPSALDSVNELPSFQHSTMDTLDSIDDEIPLSKVPKKKKKKTRTIELDSFMSEFRPSSEADTDSLVDGGHISDLDSIGSGRSEEKLASKKLSKPNSRNGDEISMSRSSSRSDISEQSDISSDAYSKPGKPSAVVHPRTASPAQKLFPWLNKSAIVSNPSVKLASESISLRQSPIFSLKQNLNSVERTEIGDEQADTASGSDQDTAFVSDNVFSDAKAATAEYIKQVDTEFVAELAASVVDQMFTGKTLTEVARNSAIKQVSADIWKDFEHQSKMSGKESPFGIQQQTRSRYSWANSSSDYGRTKGKYVEDFMKRHYKQPVTKKEKPSNSFIPSASLSWSTNDDSEPRSTIAQNFLPYSNYSIQSNSETPNYNLFDGPSLAFNAVSPSGDNSSGFPTSSASSLTVSKPISSVSLSQAASISSIPAPLPLPKSHISKYDNPLISTQHVSTNNVYVQAAPVLVATETNTDPYEPFKEDFVKANHQNEILTGRLHGLTTQVQELSIKAQEKEYRCKELELEIDNKKSMFDMEKRNWDDERQSFTRELQRLKQQSISKDGVETELKDKLSQLQKEISEILQEREKQLQDQTTALEQFRKNHELEVERAKHAEIQILKMRLQAALQMYERGQKEAGFHHHHLSGFLKKHVNENVTVPAQLPQVLAHWKSNMQKIEETVQKLKSEFEDHIKKIDGGMRLMDLPPIAVPSPPQPPDPVRQPLQAGSMSPLALMPAPVTNGMAQPGVFLHPPRQISPKDSSEAIEKVPQTSAPASMPAPISQPAPLSTMAQVAQQRPIAQPLVAPGLTPLRPSMPVAQNSLASMMNRVPLRPPVPLSGPPGVPLPQPPKNSFEKLIGKMQILFPKYSRADFTKLIQDLRNSRGGSLSGMDLDEIIRQVTNIIQTQEQTQRHVQQMAPQVPIALPTEMVGMTKPVAPPPGLSSSWAFQSSTCDTNNLQPELFHEELDPCVICHEEMLRQPTLTLECQHKFHDECIRKWLREQSTCPNCRVHALLSDEFPTL